MLRFATILSCCLFCLSGPFVSGETASPPNVVIIIGDDCCFYDYGCWGNTIVKTPNLDKLASEGMKLTRFYSPASVCSPLRQALLTGMFPIRNGAYPNHSKVYPEVKTMPTFLKPLGYRTACVGKTHFNPRENYPFDLFLGMVGEDNNVPAGQPTSLQKLEKFVTESGKDPFCLYIASNEPHGPHDKGDPSVYDESTFTIPPYMVDTPETRSALKAYYAEITYLDGQVGTVLNLLERTGHSKDTLVLFFSEQGSGMTHGKWTLYDAGIRVAAIAKWPGHIKPNSESTALVQYVDVLPTLIDLAGGDPLACQTGRPDAKGFEGFDGKSFANVLLGKTNTCRDYAFAQHTARGITNGPDAYATRAVTDGNWKLIYNVHHDKSIFQNGVAKSALFLSWVAKAEAGDAFAKERTEWYFRRPEWELYNLQSDPWELKNVADVPENAEKLNSLRRELRKWMAAQGDQGHATEMAANSRQTGDRSEEDNSGSVRGSAAQKAKRERKAAK